MLRKKRWRRFFSAQERIDRVERDHELQLDRHQTDVILGSYMFLIQSHIVLL